MASPEDKVYLVYTPHKDKQGNVVGYEYTDEIDPTLAKAYLALPDWLRGIMKTKLMGLKPEARISWEGWTRRDAVKSLMENIQDLSGLNVQRRDVRPGMEGAIEAAGGHGEVREALERGDIDLKTLIEATKEERLSKIKQKLEAIKAREKLQPQAGGPNVRQYLQEKYGGIIDPFGR